MTSWLIGVNWPRILRFMVISLIVRVDSPSFLSNVSMRLKCAFPLKHRIASLLSSKKYLGAGWLLVCNSLHTFCLA